MTWGRSRPTQLRGNRPLVLKRYGRWMVLRACPAGGRHFHGLPAHSLAEAHQLARLWVGFEHAWADPEGPGSSA